MKKILSLILGIILSVNLLSQNIKKPTIIIGVGQSDNTEIFNQVTDYTMTCQKDLKVIFICEQHKVIVIETSSDRYKDPMTLVETLEKIFPNTDFFVKQDDDIIKKDCKDEYEKSKDK